MSDFAALSSRSSKRIRVKTLALVIEFVRVVDGSYWLMRRLFLLVPLAAVASAMEGHVTCSLDEWVVV